MHVHRLMPTIQEIKLGSPIPTNPNTATPAKLPHRLKKAVQQACARGVVLRLLGCCTNVCTSHVAMSSLLVAIESNHAFTLPCVNIVFVCDQECAKMLWSFFQKALESPCVNVDTAFREMLNLSCSWPGCRPFAKEPARPASFFASDPTSGAAPASAVTPSYPGDVHNRLAQVKRGSKLDDVATVRAMKGNNSARSASYAGNTRSRVRSSVAQDKRTIKMVGGGLYSYAATLIPLL